MNTVLRFQKKQLPIRVLLLILLTALSFTSKAQVVAEHGLLKVKGNRVVNKKNEAVSLAGNSFFWSNNGWGGERYYTTAVVKWLKQDWGTTIVRAAMGVEDPGGYIEKPADNLARLKVVVDAAIAEGMYVIIDWHSHHAEDHTEAAIAFFEDMARTYGEKENIIYEIYNEPLKISWSGVVKPYAEKVIAAIRAIDPDNMIIVGSPEWSQKVDDVANDPITGFENIAYTLHFYTVHHKQWLRDRANVAMGKGIALFVTEWGSIGYTQNDPETKLWMDWCKQNNISHCNWAVNDKKEEWSILNANASTQGNWTSANLTEAGKLARNIIKYWKYPSTVSVDLANTDTIRVFPNPSNHLLFLDNLRQRAEVSTLQVVSVSGQVVLSASIPPQTPNYELDISALPSGNYLLVLQGKTMTIIKD